MPDSTIDPNDILWHQSGVNKKGEAFVQLIRGENIIAQMDPQQARDHARGILETTEAAEQDAFFLGFLKSNLDLDHQAAMAIIMDFRAVRIEQTGKKSGARNSRDWVMPPKKEG